MENKYGGDKIRYLPVIVVLTGLLYSFFAESRSFFMGFAVAGCYLVVTSSFFPYNKKRTLLISGGALAGILCFLVFFVKPDSSRGRMLIYKISSTMFRDHYLTGLGPGRFKTEYLAYQAAYFRKGDYTEQELLLAGNTYFAFNDYWQFMIEYGVAGILMFGAMGILLLYGVIRLPADKKKQLLYNLAIIILITICVAACFNHQFEKLWVQLTFLSSISILSWGHLYKRRKIRPFFITGIFLFAALLVFQAYGQRLINRRVYQHWETSKTMARAGFITESLDHCRAVAPSLADNGSFMGYYGRQLMRARRYKQAIAVLNQALDHRKHHQIYVDLGNCYRASGHMEEAEQALLTAVYMVPNRFESRFALFECYMASGQISEATFWGKSILSLPIKILSLRVDKIQEQVARKLRKLE
ncbi:O-antigen ligase family protein [Sinomicrobium soli]|uniref:O-antigen ligase family protein n=1 Tax=Sinomicrobium sp. N-1-3-6 TaxID=2219864 RepID=UPI001374F931|nr:O-antigen ligase family protein [Sinomicrobium sp. N-1-3-6]